MLSKFSLVYKFKPLHTGITAVYKFNPLHLQLLQFMFIYTYQVCALLSRNSGAGAVVLVVSL